ncbi:Oxygen sensor protein DosP [compost metagenome]
MAHGADDEIIIEAAIAMAHKLGLVVIAEGVESPEQVDALRRLSCDQIQGYVFSRPLPAGDALQLITANDMAEA